MNHRSAKKTTSSQPAVHKRRGAAYVMIAIMLFTFAMMSAFMIDYSYMQLVRSQTRMVADSAARAGAEALVRTRDPNQAIQAALNIARMNDVAGKPFQLSESDIFLGQSIAASNGSWDFRPGVAPYNSVRVTPRVNRDAPFGAAPLFFGGVTGKPIFETKSQATAGEQPVEICLVVDRSLSMSQEAVDKKWVTIGGVPTLLNGPFWPLANHDSLYPLSYYSNNRTLQVQHSPPHQSISRWQAAMEAVDVFFTECGKAVNPPRIGLVTFSSQTTQSRYPFFSYSTASVDASMPSGSNSVWSQNLQSVKTALQYLTDRPMSGNTNTQAGLLAAVNHCSGVGGMVQSKKVIILLTDGQHDPGASPIPAAYSAAALGITVHCVSMLTTYQTTLSDVASITGGKYYVTGTNATSNEQSFSELQVAFRDLANQIPIVLMD